MLWCLITWLLGRMRLYSTHGFHRQCGASFVCVGGDRGMGSSCRDFGRRRDTSLRQDCSLWDVSGQRDVRPSAASNPPCRSCCSDNVESHPSVIHLWAALILFWYFPALPAVFLPFCPLWRSHSAGDVGFPLVLWLWAAGSKLVSLWQRVPAAQWGVTPQGDKESPSSCHVPTAGNSVLWHPRCCVLGSSLWRQRFLGFFWHCKEVATKEWQDGHCWPPAGQAKDSSLSNSCFSLLPAQK